MADSVQISTSWERPVIAGRDGSAWLVIRITAEDQALEPENRSPLDLAFALDRSGSMAPPDKLPIVIAAVQQSAHYLTERDRVALVFFDDQVTTALPLTRADGAGKHALSAAVTEAYARGSTNLFGGWFAACHELATGETPDDRRSRRAMLLTDGLANVGERNPRRLMQHATELHRRGVSTSTIGVGFGFDEMLLSSMAEAGGGAFQYIAETGELEPFFRSEIGNLARVAARRPYLQVMMPRSCRASLVNAFPATVTDDGLGIDLRDLSAGDEITLVVRVRARFLDADETITPMVHLHWTDPASGSIVELDVAGERLTVGDPETAPVNAAAAEATALERAARDHREAIQLDRQGRYDESRQRFRESAQLLLAAPQTESVAMELAEADRYAQMNASAPMSEHSRKDRVYKAQARSRGQRSSR